MSNIIIAGDWVVDEYWYLVRHHSEISSHTGFVHYRSSSKPTERIIDLCSAGHVARVLYTLRSEPDKYYKIWGIGNWNNNDTDHLLHLIHAHDVQECQAPLANFSLERRLCNNPLKDIMLFPLHPDKQTTRVVRLYQSTGTGIDQMSRIDWELATSNEETSLTNLPDGLPTINENDVTSIVIHDLCKGAVTDTLVRRLNNQYPKAHWYVRTKSKEPTWLTLIADKIALFLIGPEVAEPGNPWGNWLNGTKISFQSLNFLGESRIKTSVVLLTDSQEAVGRINNGEKCITAKAPQPYNENLQVGWPSALLAAFVHLLHTTRKALDENTFKEALEMAYDHAGMPVMIQSGKKSLISGTPVVHMELWEQQETEWNQAMTDMGIILPAGAETESHLDLWRGSSDLPGYVACIKGKRDRITEIGKRLRAFAKQDNPARSVSFLLQADPGSGKTHLARLLAQHLDFSLLPFDITQMLHRDDLLDLFDAIATEQANHPGRRVLVMVDEVNAHLDADAVYSSFLAPLEQGVYVRRGRVFSLKPCVWVFAGTDIESTGQPKSVKISDFEQRLTATVKLDYRSLKAETKDNTEREHVRLMAKLEQVYLGVMMIQRRYPDVNRVGKLLLRKFSEYDPEQSPARKIRKVVEELRNVQYGIVTLRNVSPEHTEERDLIRLVV